ncbi:Serine-protein kinase ATM like protein [Argiope bruennichi]|uniref:Serine-protein kinase ATM like protein n=1 Tax=Argiope bruennichi TaxID=94029 RepID=A0A8T0ES32_ARGBR|nr:Serine-protein kinase ATM like protein [Argiope bruennichi]
MEDSFLNQQYDMAKPVMDHILAVLHESYTRIAFGCEYSHALSKNVLSDPFMCLKIPAADFDAAIWFYCKIIKNPPHGWDRSSMTQVLLHLLTVRSNMGTLEVSKLFDFFEYIFDAVKSEKVSNHHENLLKALLLVCRIFGVDCRLRLCQLGESVMFPLMQLWKTRPSEICSELMLEFVSFQLAIHHPKGTVIHEKGARAHEWNSWKSHLLNLFKIFVQEIDELCEKNKYSSSKETILKPVFVSVFVEICAQVFVDNVGALDVTQMSSTHDSTQASKKRRVEVNFRTFIDSLTSSKIVPWLQVISAYIIKYPETIPIEEAEHLLEILIDINLSCNQFETKNWLLTCFQSFVESFGVSNNENFSETNFQWQRLWDIAVKSVALMNQCHEASHKLLSTLLSHKLIVPKVEFYNLFTQGSNNHVTYASLRTLRVFLETYPSLSPVNACFQNTIQNISSVNSSTFENRILDWLFSRKSDDNSPFQVLSNETDCLTVEEFAKVLTLLSMKNSELRSYKELVSTDLEKVRWISDLEEKLLHITFDLPMKYTDIKQKEEKLIKTPSGVLCAPVWEKILNFFIGVSSSIFEQQTIANQTLMSSIFIKHASLLIEVLQVFYFQRIIKDEDLNSNHFTSFIRKFLNTAIELEMQKENGIPNVQLLKDFMNNTVAIFKRIQHCNSDAELCNFITAVGSAIPIEILKDLLNFSLENINEKKSLSRASVSTSDQNLNLSRSLKKNKYSFDDDDSDIEMDCLESIPDSEDTSFSTEMENISSDFKEQLQCLEILGDYCSFVSSDTRTRKTDSFPEIMIKRLISVLSTKIQNLSDVHLILVSLKCILVNKYLEDSVIETVISTLKLLLNQFNIMQDVCISILKLFPLLIQHVVKSDATSPVTIQNKSHMLHLTRVLSKRELDKRGSSMTSYLVADIIITMLKIEPSISWPESSNKLNDTELNPLGNTVICTLVQFLSSSFAEVCFLVASSINFVLSRENLISTFDFTSKETFNFLQSQESSDLDSCVNRVNTFFHFMSHVILHFPCLENEALFVMCKIVQTKKIDQSFLAKVFAHLSIYFGFSSTKNFIELHLICLFHKWIEAKFNLEDFPFEILGTESYDAFIKEYYKVLVPVLFFMDDFSSISKIAEKLHISKSDAIYTCLPSIQAQILSDFAAENSTRNPNKAKSVLNSLIPTEVSDKAFLTKLDEFVVCLLGKTKRQSRNHLVNAAKRVKLFLPPLCDKTSVGFFQGWILRDTDSGRKAFSFLSYLIIDCEVHLADYIPYLDPFPDSEMFQSLSNKYNQIKYRSGKLSLKQEITLFLKSYKMMGKATITGLQHLCKQLKTRQPELLEILNSLKGTILFSEDVKSSVHHQLICELASICTLNNVPLEVQKAASDCMGAIGPVVFSSVVLQPSSNVSSEGLNSLQQGYAVILNLLTDYLCDKRIDIKVEGSEKACQYNIKLESIKVFHCGLPETTGHYDWIITLVCTIIKMGPHKNNLMNVDTNVDQHGFQECLFKSQQSLISENSIIFEKYFNEAQKTQFEYLKHTSLEASRNILPILSHIQMMSVLQDFSKMQSNSQAVQDILNSWDLQDQMPYEDFEFVEPVSWLKCILLKHCVDTTSRNQWHARVTVINEVKKLLERYSVRARNEMHLEIRAQNLGEMTN